MQECAVYAILKSWIRTTSLAFFVCGQMPPIGGMFSLDLYQLFISCKAVTNKLKPGISTYNQRGVYVIVMAAHDSGP